MRRADLAKTATDSYADWYKDAVVYQMHMKAFADSNGDGIGDFRGATERLPYLRDLGVTAVWVLPFYPSPLKDDGYDIAHYTEVHPQYGTLKDFKDFLKEAHRLGLKVITELVINHTSDQHEWFQRARRAKKGDPARDFYVWSDSPEKYKGVRIIFKDFEHSNWTYDPVAQSYYWHRFYSHQPDLNFDNPKVLKAIYDVMDFWLEMGVDGMRLDAIPYLHEREGTSCENLPETHEVLKKLRKHVDKKFSNRMLLAEANQWPEDAVQYFGDGDECHMSFHFPLMPRMYMAVSMEDRFPILDILDQTPEIPEGCQWANFLRNHDELTLEMVTDEERDYMWRMFARDPRARINLGIRRRLAPLLGNNRRLMELMNGLLFSMPGTPIIYYGDEIGMGDNIYLGDRNGVRTPLQWNSDKNAGFSKANPQRLFLPVIVDPEYHYEAVNIEAQQQNPSSLLWWMKRLIELAKRYKAFNRGEIHFLEPDNRKVLAFTRTYEDEKILVVANLSRHTQCVELDLSAFEGMIPTELFGSTIFPRIGELPYFITLSPHSFYWFALEKPEEDELEHQRDARQVPHFELSGPWKKTLPERLDAQLQKMLPKYLPSTRWFGGKARKIKSVTVADRVVRPDARDRHMIALLRVEYTEGNPEAYSLPLAVATGEKADTILRDWHNASICTFSEKGEETAGLIYDGIIDPDFCSWLPELISEREVVHGTTGSICPSLTKNFKKRRAEIASVAQDSRVLRGEQSNSSVIYGDRFILKYFRRLEEGTNPDLEIGRFLTEKAGYRNSPPVAGSLEYQVDGLDPATMAIMHEFVPNEGDAWKLTLDFVGRYVDQALSREAGGLAPPAIPQRMMVEVAQEEFPVEVKETMEPYLSLAWLLGQRTMEMHQALASEEIDAAFTPEPFTPFYQRSLYQSLRNITDSSMSRLKKASSSMDDSIRPLADEVLARRSDVQKVFQAFLEKPIPSMRTRCHGDYHLGQVLYTGKDFHIIDYEGEPVRSISERKIKRCPLRDVAGMLRSFDYAAYFALTSGNVRTEDVGRLQPWLRAWTWWVSAAFLKGYFHAGSDSSFLPESWKDTQALIDGFVMEKALYEIIYELSNRPDWVRVPLQGVLQLTEEKS